MLILVTIQMLAVININVDHESTGPIELYKKKFSSQKRVSKKNIFSNS
jgi:hypothetical protein